MLVVKRKVESAVHLQGSPTAFAHSTVHQILVNVKIHFLNFETPHATSICDALLVKCGSSIMEGYPEMDANLNLVRRVNWVESTNVPPGITVLYVTKTARVILGLFVPRSNDSVVANT
mmetsp:Transcript_5894/g.6648  ORF Transcript_5894/g.6648 Transcript_5894/m.6648 type:complete len:118 (+) Transcript_5894:471-824(+)